MAEDETLTGEPSTETEPSTEPSTEGEPSTETEPSTEPTTEELLDKLTSLKELLERMNQFLYKEEQFDDDKLQEYIKRVAGETGLSEENIIAVANSVLTIMEERKEERGIKSGGAFPAYRVRPHAGRKRFWGGW